MFSKFNPSSEAKFIKEIPSPGSLHSVINWYFQVQINFRGNFSNYQTKFSHRISSNIPFSQKYHYWKIKSFTYNSKQKNCHLYQKLCHGKYGCQYQNLCWTENNINITHSTRSVFRFTTKHEYSGSKQV